MFKFSHFFFAVLLFTSTAKAIELGQIETSSYLNEPLKAHLSFKGVDAVDLDDIHFSLASHREYKNLLGISRPDYLAKLQFKIDLETTEPYTLQITSRQRIIEPILQLLLKVTEPQSSFIKQYTLLMDPEIVAATPILKERSKPSTDTDALIPETTIASSVSTLINTQTIKVKDRSISIIAQNSTLHERYSVYQIMRAFYLVNPSAFEKGNIDKLMGGSDLWIPEESLIAEVPRQKAINFVYAVSKDNPKITVKPVKIAAQTQPSGSPRPSLAQSEKPSIGHTPARVDHNDQNMHSELQKLRSTDQEFNALAKTLESQNQALKAQNEVLQSLSKDLSNHEDEIQQLGLRLSDMKILQQNPMSEGSEQAPVTRQVFTDQTQLIEAQQKIIQSINAGLKKKNAELFALKNQIKTLEPLNPTSVTQPIPEPSDPKNKSISGPSLTAPKIVTYSPTTPAVTLSQIWALVLIMGILGLFGIREWIWQRRFRSIPTSSNKKTSGSEKSKVKITQQAPIQADGGEIELKDLQSPKKAHDDYIDTIVERSPLTMGAGSINEVKIEIDVLLAYEQYEEAMQLLKESKVKFGEAPWLDIKELEILASSRQSDLFYKLYNAKKDLLEQELPEAWEKVDQMHQQLGKEFKISAVR